MLFLLCIVMTFYGHFRCEIYFDLGMWNRQKAVCYQDACQTCLSLLMLMFVYCQAVSSKSTGRTVSHPKVAMSNMNADVHCFAEYAEQNKSSTLVLPPNVRHALKLNYLLD